MTTALVPFTPKADVPQWQPIFDWLTDRRVGEVITYEQFSDIFGYDIRDSAPGQPGRGPFYKAVEHWGNEQHRAVESLRNQGYRVIPAVEHERLAKKHVKKSRRQMTRSILIIEQTDESQLTVDQRRRKDEVHQVLSRLEQMVRRQQRDLARVQEALGQESHQRKQSEQELQRQIDGVKDEVAAMLERRLAQWKTEQPTQS